MMRKRDIILIILCIAIVPVLFFAGSIYQTQKVVLPGEVIDLKTFLEKMPMPEHAYMFERDGIQYIELQGTKPGFPAVPSGPPAYVFDVQGNLVFWTIDVGDSTTYWSLWGNIRLNYRDVTLEDVTKMAQRRK